MGSVAGTNVAHEAMYVDLYGGGSPADFMANFLGRKSLHDKDANPYLEGRQVGGRRNEANRLGHNYTGFPFLAPLDISPDLPPPLPLGGAIAPDWCSCCSSLMI